MSNFFAVTCSASAIIPRRGPHYLVMKQHPHLPNTKEMVDMDSPTRVGSTLPLPPDVQTNKTAGMSSNDFDAAPLPNTGGSWETFHQHPGSNFTLLPSGASPLFDIRSREQPVSSWIDHTPWLFSPDALPDALPSPNTVGSGERFPPIQGPDATMLQVPMASDDRGDATPIQKNLKHGKHVA